MFDQKKKRLIFLCRRTLLFKNIGFDVEKSLGICTTESKHLSRGERVSRTCARTNETTRILRENRRRRRYSPADDETVPTIARVMAFGNAGRDDAPAGRERVARLDGAGRPRRIFNAVSRTGHVPAQRDDAGRTSRVRRADIAPQG